MVSLTIELQDGFLDDTVAIEVNGVLVYEGEGVKTDFSVTRADSFEVRVREGAVTIDVSVPSRALTGRIEQDLQGDGYLGISVDEGGVVGRFSAEDFVKF